MILTDYNQGICFWLQCRNKKAVFVDYFDTLVKTVATPSAINLQVCRCVLEKIPVLKEQFTPSELVKLFLNSVVESRKKYDDAPFNVVVSMLFSKLNREDIDEEQFLKVCRRSYEAVVVGGKFLISRCVIFSVD